MDFILRIPIIMESILLFGTGLLLPLGRRRSAPNTLLGTVLILFAYYLFIRWLFWTELIRAFPFLLDTDVVAITAIPPLLYLYVVKLLKPRENNREPTLMLFIPIIIGIVWYGFSQLFLRPPVDVYLQYPLNRYPFWEIDASFSMLMNLQMFAYLIYTTITIHKCLSNCPSEIKNHVRMLFILFISLILCMVLNMIVVQYDSLTPYTIGQLLFGGIGISMTILNVNFPKYLHGMQKFPYSIRKNSLLKNRENEVKRIMQELDQLVIGEKLYRDPDISLQELSNSLGTTVYNLSFILNEKIGMNFCSYINCNRIREAQLLLAENNDKTILEIAFEVGFNSKSTFNAMFKKQTGLSPSEYRNTHQNSK